MNPVIGDVVIVRRLKVDQTGDDNDPAIVNTVRRVADLPRVPRLGEADYRGGPAAIMPDGSIQRAIQTNPVTGEVIVAPLTPTGLSKAQEEAEKANIAAAVAVAENPDAPKAVVVELPKPVPPLVFISATVFSENGRTRFVRNVPFFESPADADLWPKPPVTPTNVDAGLVAYPKAESPYVEPDGRYFDRNKRAWRNVNDESPKAEAE